jgi:hypothetical protein
VLCAKYWRCHCESPPFVSCSPSVSETFKSSCCNVIVSTISLHVPSHPTPCVPISLVPAARGHAPLSCEREAAGRNRRGPAGCAG